MVVTLGFVTMAWVRRDDPGSEAAIRGAAAVVVAAATAAVAATRGEHRHRRIFYPVGSCKLSPILLVFLAHAFNATTRGITAAGSIWPCLADLRTGAER